ncbi:hypothetical protein P9738_15145 [Bacillus siamensis]|uniref:hypothetical protein n=1 Tax=Bacillus siamensis TaxID=659243 RepID=UPI002E23754A|nr:hypothetical protein [Bacillus siamensis]MED5097497.1 hypothetical protein [Bacillus siamensis]
MWGAIVKFIMSNAGKVLSWAKKAWSAAKYSKFANAVAKGGKAVINYCTNYPGDCWSLIKAFL